ncbi:MAG TPA: hypothetical protein VFF06_01955 [Polyangia bacterium]|nr:hypothetical protein [Polyangia bacterium]
MGVIIDQVDGEIHDSPAAPPPAASQGAGAQADTPENDLEEMQRKLTLMHRRHHRLHAD